jgi:hypothetical protein
MQFLNQQLKNTTYSIIQSITKVHWSPIFLVVIQIMPQYMTTVLAVLKNNTIHYSFSSDSLLNFIGGLAKKYSYICLCTRYDSEDCFVGGCVEVVCCSYIFRAMEHDENQL